MEWPFFNGPPHSYPSTSPQIPASSEFEEDPDLALSNAIPAGTFTTGRPRWSYSALLSPDNPTHDSINFEIPIQDHSSSQLLLVADAAPIPNDRPIIASGDFIIDVDDLNTFRENGFSPAAAIAIPGSQGSRSPNQRNRQSRSRRPSHSATSVTTNQPAQCPCPYQECTTVRDHMSHIVNHLIQKHGFKRAYLNSVQNTAPKRKKECVIVNYERQYAFCNWCWATFHTPEHIYQHINQSSRCPNHQNYSKDVKQSILQTMMDGSASQSSKQLASDVSQSTLGSAATSYTDFDHIGTAPWQSLNWFTDPGTGAPIALTFTEWEMENDAENRNLHDP